MRYGDATKILPNVKCPYFISVTEKSVTCEGIEKSAKVTVIFSTKEEKVKMLEKHCYKFPNECPLAKVISGKYEVKK